MGTVNRWKPRIADTTPAAAFVSAILDGKPNLAPAHEGTYAVALTEAAYRSAAEKRIVPVDVPVHPKLHGRENAG
jgi:predicted dehydrogenase